ncbi:MAG: hypothetical protein Q4G58_05065 [bacterium]|nr:hypothetical protein [bacterium]
MIEIDGREHRTNIEDDYKPMTRAEWVKYAREQCEKQLPVFEEYEPEEESYEEDAGPEILHAVYIPTKNLPRGEEIEESLFEEDKRSDRKKREEEVEEPDEEEEPFLVRKPKLHASQYDGAIDVNDLEPIKWSYMTKLGVRFAAAVVIALFVITIDYFGVKALISGDQIKTAMSQNDAIETMEESVSSFAKEKVLPLLGLDKEEQGQETNTQP